MQSLAYLYDMCGAAEESKPFTKMIRDGTNPAAVSRDNYDKILSIIVAGCVALRKAVQEAASSPSAATEQAQAMLDSLR